MHDAHDDTRPELGLRLFKMTVYSGHIARAECQWILLHSPLPTHKHTAAKFMKKKQASGFSRTRKPLQRPPLARLDITLAVKEQCFTTAEKVMKGEYVAERQ